MKAVAVLGAGVVGATSAYELAKAGFEVTVVDRQPGPGLETSFANGGQISANHATPWATPENLKKAATWFGRADSPLVIRPRFDPRLFSWMLKFIGNCRASRVARNTERALRVALYSRDRLGRLGKELRLDYDRGRTGILHLFKSETDMAASLPQAEAMTKLGCRRDILNREEVLQMEPSLRDSLTPIVGGALSAEDETGDAYKFTTGIWKAATALGAVFRFGETIRAIETKRRKIRRVKTDRGMVEADFFVMALGSHGPAVLKPLGVSLPVYPAKGYSLTIPLDENDKAPRVALIDDEAKIVYTRLGDRLRVAGTAEFAGYDPSPDPRRSNAVLSKAHELLPSLNDGRPVESWCGLRPMTPDQVPILGRTRYENLVLNTGHGTLGWTMAAGSARVVADLLAGRTPEISLDGLELERFERSGDHA